MCSTVWRVGGDVLFENAFDEVNAAARPFEFVAGEQVGGAGGIAKAAVDAGAQNLFGRLNFWVLEQMGGNGRAHYVSSVRPAASARGPCRAR